MIDAGFAVLSFFVLVAPLLMVDRTPQMWVVVGWSALMTASVAFRRVAPMVALVICGVAGAGMVLQLSAPSPAIVIVLVITYSIARYTTTAGSLALLPIAFAASLAGPLSWLGSVAGPQRFVAGSLMVTLCMALLMCAFLLGRRLQERSRFDALDREVAEERFVTSAQRTQQATQLADGRARAEVARELHDVVAHSLSVIVVQAEGAKALASKRPEAAVEALDVIARTGRSSIGEMRRIVGLLRGEEEAAFGPTPSLRQIPEMVAKAGPRIELEMPGECPPVPDSLGLAVFRVVQESVTNFLKHAGPTATAKAVVECGAADIQIRVTDDGIGSQSSSDNLGAGVRGMRERVTAMGGTFKAGPRTGGGYEVRATLPLPAQLGRSWLR